MQPGLTSELRRTGRVALGTSCMMPTPMVAAMLAEMEFDFIMVDCQHGLIGPESLPPLLDAILRTQTAPWVRTPPRSPARITAAVQAGAQGIIVPMVNGAADAAEAVAAIEDGAREGPGVAAIMLIE